MKNGMSSGMEKMMGRFMFRQVETVVWDLMTGNLGVQTTDGIATIAADGENTTISINPFDDFGFAVPAFAQSTNIKDVKKGDLIYTNGTGTRAKWVIDVIKKSEEDDTVVAFKTIDTSGNINRWNPPKVQVLGFDSGVMVVKSLGELFGGTNGVQGFQNSLMPFMMMAQTSGTELDFGKLMPLMLMQQMQGGSGNGGMGGMMQMLMMQQMMGGSNPFANLLGGSTNTPRHNSPFRG